MAKRKGRKIRVDFRRNRNAPPRAEDLTRRFRDEAARDGLVDSVSSESVRSKGAQSRKRTVIVDEHDAPLVDAALWLPAVVTTIHGLVCRVEEPGGRRWDCTVRRVLRTLLIEQRAPVTVGDRVWLSDQSAHHGGQPVGVIERVAPRSTLLTRAARGHRAHALVANADQVLIVTSVAMPNLKPHLIDRYLVAAAKGGLRPLIAFNKCDLWAPAPSDAFDDPPEEAPPENTPAAELPVPAEDELCVDLEAEDYDGPPLTPADIFAEFSALGVQCLWTSAVTGQGISELRTALHDHVTVLSGQSGVGKSSLINAVQPDLHLATAEVSEETEKGRHTTTHARLLRLTGGGYVVDTPGIRAFDLWDVQPGELEAYFPEIAALVRECHFKDCHHTHEPDCAVRAAFESGSLSARRYFSYLKLLAESTRESRAR